jgi:hypothetical protein
LGEAQDNWFVPIWHSVEKPKSCEISHRFGHASLHPLTPSGWRPYALKNTQDFGYWRAGESWRDFFQVFRKSTTTRFFRPLGFQNVYSYRGKTNLSRGGRVLASVPHWPSLKTMRVGTSEA